MFNEIELVKIQEPISAFSFDDYCADKKIVIDDFYSNSERLRDVAFILIDGLRANKSYDSSMYVAISFDNVKVADMIQTWDFKKYNFKIEYYVKEDLSQAILMVYT